MTDERLYLRAKDTWGELSQLCMTVEECAELIVAVLHALRGRYQLPELAEEVADVMIMCEQLRLMVGEELVDEAKVAKLARLRMRLGDDIHPIGCVCAEREAFEEVEA